MQRLQVIALCSWGSRGCCKPPSRSRVEPGAKEIWHLKVQNTAQKLNILEQIENSAQKLNILEQNKRGSRDYPGQRNGHRICVLGNKEDSFLTRSQGSHC